MAETIAVDDYQKMVGSIARKYCYNESDYDDLFQVGMMELWKATDKFDSGLGVKFSTYAYSWVHGAINKYARENKVIKVSKDLINLNRSINNAREVQSQILMRQPSKSELSDFIGVDISVVDQAEMANDYVRSLDYELNDDGKDLNLYDSISYEEKGYDPSIMDLRNRVENLPEPDRTIIYSRYFEDRSQSETAELLGTSQVQVSRKEGKVLQKLYSDMVA